MLKVYDACNNCILHILRMFKIRLNAFHFGNTVARNMHTALVTTLQTADKLLSENLIWNLRAILQNTFQDASQNWKKRWKQCIKGGVEYFEGEKFD
jgi:hypothetical protein